MFQTFIVAIYILQAGVFALFVVLERNRGGGEWRLKHVVLMVAAAIWPLVLALTLVVASVKAVATAFSRVGLMMSRSEGSNLEAGNRAQ